MVQGIGGDKHTSTTLWTNTRPTANGIHTDMQRRWKHAAAELSARGGDCRR